MFRGFAKVTLMAAALLLALALTPVRGKDEAENDRPDDRAAIGKRSQEFLQALAKGDVKAVAAFWTDSGEYARGEVLTIRGRAAIEKAYAEHLKRKQPGTIELRNDSIRFLSDDTAIQNGTFVVKRSNPADSVRSRFNALWVRARGQWHFGLLRETPEGPSLHELAWLAGAWTSKTENGSATAVYEWTENKAFLRCTFTFEQDGKKHTGFQILGIDPATGAIKSWSFEDDGGIGEAVWTRTEKGWSAKSTAFTGDGEKVTATVQLIPEDENTFAWQSVDRTVDGEKVPDIAPIKAMREKATR